MTNENKQQDRLREIDELLFECQRHNIPAISVTYAQLKAFRAELELRAQVPDDGAKDAAGIWMREFVNAVEHEAFNMRAPNTHTPVLVGMCIEARRRLLAANKENKT